MVLIACKEKSVDTPTPRRRPQAARGHTTPQLAPSFVARSTHTPPGHIGLPGWARARAAGARCRPSRKPWPHAPQFCRSPLVSVHAAAAGRPAVRAIAHARRARDPARARLPARPAVRRVARRVHARAAARPFRGIATQVPILADALHEHPCSRRRCRPYPPAARTCPRCTMPSAHSDRPRGASLRARRPPQCSPVLAPSASRRPAGDHLSPSPDPCTDPCPASPGSARRSAGTPSRRRSPPPAPPEPPTCPTRHRRPPWFTTPRGAGAPPSPRRRAATPRSSGPTPSPPARPRARTRSSVTPAAAATAPPITRPVDASARCSALDRVETPAAVHTLGWDGEQSGLAALYLESAAAPVAPPAASAATPAMPTPIPT